MQYELEYEVLSSETQWELVLAVRSRILQGWVPEGGMSVAIDSFESKTDYRWDAKKTYYQTMTHQRRLPGT